MFYEVWGELEILSLKRSKMPLCAAPLTTAHFLALDQPLLREPPQDSPETSLILSSIGVWSQTCAETVSPIFRNEIAPHGKLLEPRKSNSAKLGPWASINLEENVTWLTLRRLCLVELGLVISIKCLESMRESAGLKWPSTGQKEPLYCLREGP